MGLEWLKEELYSIEQLKTQQWSLGEPSLPHMHHIIKLSEPHIIALPWFHTYHYKASLIYGYFVVWQETKMYYSLSRLKLKSLNTANLEPPI